MLAAFCCLVVWDFVVGVGLFDVWVCWLIGPLVVWLRWFWVWFADVILCLLGLVGYG